MIDLILYHISKLIEIIYLVYLIVGIAFEIDYKMDGKYNIFAVKIMDWEEWKKKRMKRR